MAQQWLVILFLKIFIAIICILIGFTYSPRRGLCETMPHLVGIIRIYVSYIMNKTETLAKLFRHQNLWSNLHKSIPKMQNYLTNFSHTVYRTWFNVFSVFEGYFVTCKITKLNYITLKGPSGSKILWLWTSIIVPPHDKMI